jgi:broad specificity phosphatase PhoE
MMHIYFIRHAQCEMNVNVDKFIGGRTNESPLTPLGLRQAAALAARLKACGWKEPPPCFSSTAIRAEHTMQMAAAALGVSPSKLQRSEALLELDQGLWQGKERQACYGTAKVKAALKADAWNFKPPQGESPREVGAVVMGTCTV